LHPTDVISANLVRIDVSGIQVALAVRTGTDGRAVQLLIPVLFQRQCVAVAGDDYLREACILERVQELDAQAYQRIAIKEERDAQSDQMSEQQRIIRQLKEEPSGDDYPDWWTFPMLNQMIDQECSLLKDLLNQESFADQIVSLFQSFYAKQNPSSSIKAFKACVASVGTSGILLRAFVEVLGEEENQFQNKELGIQFDEEAKTAELLRSSILGLVDSVQDEQSFVPQEQQEQQEEEEVKEEIPAVLQKETYIFQQKLLETRLQYDRNAKQSMKSKQQEAFQRKLLEVRLKYVTSKPSSTAAATKQTATNQADDDRKEKVQRKLLEAQLKYNQYENLQKKKKKAEVFQRKLLETQLQIKQNDMMLRAFVSSAEDPGATISTSDKQLPIQIIKARQQPKSPEEEAMLAMKYAQIEDIGERAYTILKDLYMA